MIRIYWHIK